MQVKCNECGAGKVAESNEAAAEGRRKAAGSTKGWGIFYCIVGVLYFFVALLGILTAILVANEARNSYYGSHMTEALLPWQISFCAIGMFLGFKNILLSVLFRGQARFYTVEGRRSLSDGWGETNKTAGSSA